eukprot:1224547-Lingulodinium_polyedra.AAC.1
MRCRTAAAIRRTEDRGRFVAEWARCGVCLLRGLSLEKMRRAVVDACALVCGGAVPVPCHAMLRRAAPHHAMRARAMRGGAQ